MEYTLKIDFEQLREQKNILICMIQDWGEADDPQQQLDAQKAEGILYLLDEIQDQAVDKGYASEEEVFNFKD